jgi:WD40 repeat protein
MPGKQTLHLAVALALATFAVAWDHGHAGDGKKPVRDSDALPEGALKRLGSLRWRHGEPITFLAFPSDGKTLLSASQDSVVRVWDRHTGKEIRRFVPPAEPNAKAVVRNIYMQGLTRAALSKDAKLLAVVLPSNMIQLWEVETGKALRQIKSPGNGVSALTFTPDGKTLAVRGINDRICYLHEVETGKEIRQLKSSPPGGKGGNIFGGAGDGTGIAISHDGKLIALPELEFVNQVVSGSVTIFELDSGKELRRIEMPNNGISAIAFSPDGKTLVFNTHTAIFFKEVETGKEIRQIKAVNGANLMVFAPDGQSLAIKGRDQLVRLYNPTTGALAHTLGELPGVKGNVGFVTNPYGTIFTDVAYSADSKTLVIGGQQVPRFFDGASGKEQELPSGGHRGAVTAVMTSADGKIIVSRGTEGILRVWNSATGEELRQIPEPRGTSAVLFSLDGTLIAHANNDGSIHLLNVADGKENRQFKAHQSNIGTLAFSSDGQLLATRGTYDGTLRVFDVAKGAELKQITYQNNNVGNGGNVIMRAMNGQSVTQPLVFSPDGKSLATFIAPQQYYVNGRQQLHPESNCIRVFDVSSGKELRQIPAPTGRSVQHLAYSRDGRLLISENADKTVGLWEIASGQERSVLGEPVVAPPQPTTTSFIAVGGINRIGPPTAPVGVTIAVSRDGSLIAAPGSDHSIRILDVSLGKQVGTLKGHDGAIASLAFAADGKTLISGSNDTTVGIWDLTRIKRDPLPRIAKLAPKELDHLWTDLLGDGKKSGHSIETLIAASSLSVAFLKERVPPAEPVDSKKVEQWVRDLNSSVFMKRATAISELEKLGELAIPALQKVLASQPSLETKRRVEPLLVELTGRNLTNEQIRVVRAIEVLDRIGTAEARQALQRLASGASGSLTTREAQRALDRIKAN